MNPNNIKLMLFKIGIVTVIVLITIVVLPYVLQNLIDDSITLCLFKKLTGHECWGCGMTRAVNSIMRLDFKEAYEYNTMVFIVFPMLVVFFIQRLFVYLDRLIKGGTIYGRKSS